MELQFNQKKEIKLRTRLNKTGAKRACKRNCFCELAGSSMTTFPLEEERQCVKICRGILILVLLWPRIAKASVSQSVERMLADTRPSCKDVKEPDDLVLLPKFATNTTDSQYEQMKEFEVRHVRQLSTKKRMILRAMETYFASQKVPVIRDDKIKYRNDPDKELMKKCSIEFVWGQKGAAFKIARQLTTFPHYIIVEQPWIWRNDPVDSNRTWVFLGWDYLNGHSKSRWDRYFADHVHIQPWIGHKTDGHALILGQVPNDLALLGAKTRYGSVEAAYEHIVRSIRKHNQDIEIVFRPHPLSFHHTLSCIARAPEGTTIQSSVDISLENALSQASVAISISSTASIIAIMYGIPVITLDHLSPSWPVACHSFSNFNEIIAGTACRPSRDQWLADIAYAMWNNEDIANGEAIEFLLDY